MMRDPAALGPISEGMRVMSADGVLLGSVRAVWGGFADLDSTTEMEQATGVGPGIAQDPEVSDLPEGTTDLGQTVPGYLEVEAAHDGSTLYVPLADIAEITSEQVVVSSTREEATGGLYSHDPSTTA